MRTWSCKIGECDDADLLDKEGKYYGADWPMRQAAREAYLKVTGKEAAFVFSGWAAELTEGERACVENRSPREAEHIKQATPLPEINDKNGWLYDPDAKLAEVRAAVDEEAHEHIAKICSEVGIDTPDGTSIGAVRKLADAYAAMCADAENLQSRVDEEAEKGQPVPSMQSDFDRIIAKSGTVTNPSQRLPEAIWSRYCAGETVQELAVDYGIPDEQIEWGIRIWFLLKDRVDEAEAATSDLLGLLADEMARRFPGVGMDWDTADGEGSARRLFDQIAVRTEAARPRRKGNSHG